jgi:hypothetical protein
MKKLLSGIFAFAIMFSLVFIGDAISSNGSLSVSAKSAQVTVKRRHRGVATRTKHGAKYVAHKSKRGAKWTGRKAVKGTRWTSHKTKRGTKHIYHKTKRALQ